MQLMQSNLAVVPIFVSAGAAAMPTILAALASAAAIVFRPRELVRFCRLRPRASVAVVGLTLAIVGFAVWPRNAISASRGISSMAASAQLDWTQVARDLLAREEANAPTTQSVVSPSTAPAMALKAGPVHLKLQSAFSPEGTMFLSTPLLQGQKLFAAGCQSDLGSFVGILACIDAQSGKPIWQIDQIGRAPLKPFFSSPVLSEDGTSLIIGQGLHQDRDCSLLCFDASNGKLRWSVKTPVHIESSPAVHGDLVVVGAGAIEVYDGQPTGDPGFVMGVRISDGTVLWRFALNDPECSPAIDSNGTVYIGSGVNGGMVVALRSDSDEALKQQNTSRLLWKTSVGLPVLGAVRLVDGLVIAGAGNGNAVSSNSNAQGAIVALDQKTGQIRWMTRLEDAVLGGVASDRGMIFSPVRTGEIVALSKEDGQVLWRSRINGKSPIVSGCTFAGGRLYALSGDGYLGVLNAADGNLIEKHLLNDPATPGTGLSMATPIVVENRVVVGTETGGLRILTGSGE